MSTPKASDIYNEFEKKVSCEVLDVIRAAKKVISIIPADTPFPEQRDELIRLCKTTVQSYKNFDVAMQNGMVNDVDDHYLVNFVQQKIRIIMQRGVNLRKSFLIWPRRPKKWPFHLKNFKNYLYR